MLFFHKIAISGDLGSGKSVTAKYLAEKLNYKYLSTGDIQRQMATSLQISVLEMNKLADRNLAIDNTIDQTLMQIDQTKDPYILDSRLAWHFVKNSLKIYLRTNIEITINRIMNDKNRKSEKYKTRDIAKAEIIERKASENARFFKEYGIDCADLSNYNLIIETTSVKPDEIGNLIINIASSETSNNSKYWVSPKFMYPLQNVRGLGNAHTSLSPNSYFEHKVTCIAYAGYYFIFDGHKRINAALKDNIELLPVEIITEDHQLPSGGTIENIIADSLNISYIHDWEDLHDFKFEIYPEFNSIKKSLS